MYIGYLKYGEPSFTHADTALPLLPTLQENNSYTWNWESLFDTVLEINLPLEQLSFVGAVTLTLSEKSVKKAEVLANGAVVGVHAAETGKLTGGNLTLAVGVQATALTLRLYADMKDITLQKLSILGAHDDGKPFVWPTPKALTVLGGTDPIASIQAATDDADERYAAEFLRSRLDERHGFEKQDVGVHVVLKKNCSEAYSGERYTVEYENGTLTVTAASRLTLLYGADTLLQLSTKC